jgi:hypothetical protein
MDEEELLFIHCLTITGAVTRHKGHKTLGIGEGDGKRRSCQVPNDSTRS